MTRKAKRTGRLAALVSLMVVVGCGESTEIPLAKVAPVTQSPSAPKHSNKRRGAAPSSPDILPGQAR